MKQRLLRREDIMKVVNVLQTQHPIRVLGKEADRLYPPGLSGELFTLMVDYDDLVAELNEWVYKTGGEHD